MQKTKADKFFFFLVLLLLATGFIVFFSASQSLLGRKESADFGMVAIKQFALMLAGLVGLIITTNIPYSKYRRAAFWIFFLSIIASALVFIPHLGFSSGGARRWLNLGFTTFQPSELLKFGFVTYTAYWLSTEKDKIHSFQRGILPFLIILAIPAILLIKEPDTGTFMVLLAAAGAMLVASGVRWRHLLLLVVFLLISIVALAAWKPYVRDRLETFFNPGQDILGSSYQINQSLIAIGSGGLTGRGFGQSIQKFNFLPEAIGDSIFAVLGEEFGFLGTSILVILYLLFTVWGLKIASKTSNSFGRLMAVGLVILIASQAFINISSMVGLIPLTGVPLTFMSHGGSALIIAMMEIGIILNISRHRAA